MHLTVRGNGLFYEFYEGDNQIARSSVNPLTSSSQGEITGVGSVQGHARGVFAFFRFVVRFNDKETHAFRKDTWTRLTDRKRDVELWNGEIIAAGEVVASFERSLESLIRPVFDLELKGREHLPLAMCYLPFAVGNGHV